MSPVPRPRALASLLAWSAWRLVRHRPPSERVGLAASAARLSRLELPLCGLDAIGLVALLATRVYLWGW